MAARKRAPKRESAAARLANVESGLLIELGRLALLYIDVGVCRAELAEGNEATALVGIRKLESQIAEIDRAMKGTGAKEVTL